MNNYIKIRWMRRTVIVIILPITTIIISFAFIIRCLSYAIAVGCDKFIESMQENFYGFGDFIQTIIKSWNAR